MNLLSRAFLLLACCVPMAAADTTLNADVLNRWVGGKWVGDGQFVDSDFSKANKASATTKCVWSPDHVFVTCDQDINFGGTPMRELSIYTFTPKTGKFYFYGISLGEETPRHTTLDITDNGDRWLYTSTSEISGKSVEFRTTNQFHGNDAVDWWTEFSTDSGKTWTKTGAGKETRQK
ncbi:MAG: hypothetical protein WBW69_08660 [Candidatus Korobacteraceae bacterium]